MIYRVGMDYDSKIAVFSISAAADVANLPLTNAAGKAEAEQYDKCAPGSFAYLTDGSGTKYVLDGDTNTWKTKGA